MRLADRQPDRQTDRQTDRKTERQTDRGFALPDPLPGDFRQLQC